MVYRWRDGYRASVNAQVAGERLGLIREANGGHLTPGAVVDDARPEDAPLHPAFEWDDPVAAEKYREEQARHLIRSVYVVHEDPDTGEARPSLGYVHVDLPDDGPAYVTTARAVSEADLYEQVKADAVAAFTALRRRYEHIVELADVFAAIDAIGEDQPAPRRRRRPARAAANA